MAGYLTEVARRTIQVMTIVGEWITPTLTATDPTLIDGTTAVALAVTGPDGIAIAVPSVSGPVSGVWTAEPYQVDRAGAWVELWTITGGGEGAATTTRYVDPVPPAPDYSDSYATSEDYARVIGQAGPANLPLLLRRASRQVDQVLLTAVYQLTDQGARVGRTVADELADATCEQAAFLLARGFTDGLPTGFQSVAIGSVQLGRGYSTGGGDSNALPFGDIPYAILQRAGLTGQPALTEVGPPSSLLINVAP